MVEVLKFVTEFAFIVYTSLFSQWLCHKKLQCLLLDLMKFHSVLKTGCQEILGRDFQWLVQVLVLTR